MWITLPSSTASLKENSHLITLAEIFLLSCFLQVDHAPVVIMYNEL